MRINLITKTYNEARLVPYFFRHYDRIVSNYYIWDNMSTDGTKELLLQNPKVTMFNNPDIEFDDYKHRDFKNNAWKEFKDCDYIINCDFDEFLYHYSLLPLLEYYKKIGIQICKTEGYQMFSEQFIVSEKQIYDTMEYGIREPNYDKPIIFSPDIEPNFSFGSHQANPGSVFWSQAEIKLLHYKILGPEFITDILERNNRLSERNKAEQLSYWPEEKGHRFNPVEVFEELKNKAIKVV